MTEVLPLTDEYAHILRDWRIFHAHKLNTELAIRLWIDALSEVNDDDRRAHEGAFWEALTDVAGPAVAIGFLRMIASHPHQSRSFWGYLETKQLILDEE